MDTQPGLWHDTLEDAVKDIIPALGGPKKTGGELWPGKTAADASRFLNHCLDPERPEKLTLGELLWLMKAGRQAGVHTAATFISRECGYQDPVPTDPEDEKAQLQRQFIKSQQEMKRILERMDHAQDLRAIK